MVTFNTTYLENKYNMLYAPIVGVNHHGCLHVLVLWALGPPRLLV